MSSAQAVAASFRDPAGFVYRRDGVLYRQVNATFRGEYDRLVSSGLYDELTRAGLLVAHEERPLADAAAPGAYKVLAPETIPFVSYPFEWCFSQLRDAALLTLDVQARALAHDMILRDGSALNVQFRGHQPVFVDTLSFGEYRDGQPWMGYRQFCQHFLAPLALMARRDVRLGLLHAQFPDGVPLDLASTLLDGASWARLGLLLHLHLHARAQRRYQGTKVTGAARRLEKPALLRLIEHLRATVDSLRWKPGGTVWADYEATHNYTEASFSTKESLVQALLEQVRPRTVWDLGSNTGIFSRLAALTGAEVISLDLDPGAVELNYTRLARERVPRVLPLVGDLLSPSPGSGWAGKERLSLADRGPADAVLALALVHHLTLSGNVPFGRVAAYLAELARTLVIEFVPLEDPQAQRLVANRADGHHPYTRELFEAAFETHFEIVSRSPVGDSGRDLYLMRRRGAQS